MLVDPKEVRLEKLKPYIALIERLIEGEINLNHFELSYYDLFKNDQTMWDDAEFRILATLFSDLDSYNADPALRDPGDLDEVQMLARVPIALNHLKEIILRLEKL